MECESRWLGRQAGEVREMEILEPLDITSWHGPFPATLVAKAADALESGMLLYAPQLPFALSEAERRFLSSECLDRKSKNISFRPDSGILRGTCCQSDERERLLAMLQRYYRQSYELLKSLCPLYNNHLTAGFTSFRPAEIAGRATSWRHDDTRLHVDAFPSRPMQGLRILRIFTNVHPKMPRIWRVGEKFEQAAATLFPKVKPPLPGTASLLSWLRIVKGRRTEYDHIMLGIHDHMKKDQGYQSHVSQLQLAIPPGTTWACYTDAVSHAAMSGQFAFEQTFYLPVSAMQYPERSPLRVLERLAGRKLA